MMMSILLKQEVCMQLSDFISKWADNYGNFYVFIYVIIVFQRTRYKYFSIITTCRKGVSENESFTVQEMHLTSFNYIISFIHFLDLSQ